MYQAPPPEFCIALDLLSRLSTPIQSALLGSIRNSSEAGTLTILRNPKTDPVGFVCWAGVNKDSIRIAEKFNLFPTYPWEFKEGKIALLLYVFFAYPANEEAHAAFMTFLASRRAVYYMKKNRKRLLIRTSKGFKFATVD
jgi:hemolysin-activating ACP:hemolysin acyltransferase